MRDQLSTTDAGGCGCALPASPDAGTCYCTVDVLVHAISRKHSLSILNLLGSQGATRFRAVETSLPGVGPSTLSATLRELVEVGLVCREVLPDTPPSVHYSLTESGELLRGSFHDLLDRVKDRG